MGVRHSTPHTDQSSPPCRNCWLFSCFTRKKYQVDRNSVESTEPEEKPDLPEEESVMVEGYNQRPTPRRPIFKPKTEHFDTSFSSDGDDISYLSIGPDFSFSKDAFKQKTNGTPLSSKSSLESELELLSIGSDSEDLPELSSKVTVNDKAFEKKNERFDGSNKPRIDCTTKIIKRHYQDDPGLPEPANSHHDLMAQFVESKSLSTKRELSHKPSDSGNKVIPQSWMGSRPPAPSAAEEALPRYSRYVEYKPSIPVSIPVTSPPKVNVPRTDVETEKNKTRQEGGLKTEGFIRRRGQNPALGYRSGWG